MSIVWLVGGKPAGAGPAKGDSLTLSFMREISKSLYWKNYNKVLRDGVRATEFAGIALGNFEIIFCPHRGGILYFKSEALTPREEIGA